MRELRETKVPPAGSIIIGSRAAEVSFRQDSDEPNHQQEERT